MTNSQISITIAISWCLAWGDKREPNFDLAVLQQMRQALQTGGEVPDVTRSLIEQVEELQGITDKDFPRKIAQLQEKYPKLWNQTTRIGLVYGGATKIKQYVFEAAKIQDVRGASAILDRINLHDLRAFFDTPQKPHPISNWLNENFPGLEAALIPELIIYSTGGNILAFCPAAYVHDLANAIERRYTEETLNANSCAVGDTFRLLEIRFGLLQDSIEETKWLDWYQDKKTDPMVEAYYGRPEAGQDWEELFKNRKSFNELVGKLASAFNKRRSGNDVENVELSILVKNGKSIGHSGRTFDFYQSIEKACKQHLLKYQNDVPAMLQILGWVARIMRYYKSGGSTDFVKFETETAKPNTITKVPSQEFKLGDIVEAAIANKKNVEVTYKLSNAISLTQKEHKKVNSLSVGQVVKVKIVEVRDDGRPKKLLLMD